MTFKEWWYDYCIKNGIGERAKKPHDAARAAWEAAASQGIPAYVLMALVAAKAHTGELREAWMRGVMDERDGHSSQRSNRNVDVDVAVRNAIEMLTPP